MKYPVAEIFESIQGEGYWAGTAMTFVRLAGCTVGKPYTAQAREALGISAWQERCIAWDGTGFACDTNYRKTESLTETEIVKRLGTECKRVCLTGGEPLMHDLEDLVEALIEAGIRIHLETSGTIEAPPGWRDEPMMWLTVSPKQGYKQQMLKMADEIKVLVGRDFDAGRFADEFAPLLSKIWLQPINGEHMVDEPNLRRCIAVVQEFPAVRLSTQLHKIWGVR